jgi:ABC-type glycerol-3-phosphate transport system substrate-binding protein
VAVRFAALDEKAEQWASAPEPDLPPDANLATDAELLALAQAGRLASLDDAAGKALAADPAHIEAVALERVTSDGRLWALPLCADMTVEYVNTNRPTAGEGPAGDWAGFAAGKYSRWRGASDHARALLESATAAAKSGGSGAAPPVPEWKVLSAPPGGEELGRKSLRVWAVALAAKSPKPRERALAVVLSLESGKTIDRLLGAGGKLPVHRFGQVQAYMRQLHFEGPWLDAWAAKSSGVLPQAR